MKVQLKVIAPLAACAWAPPSKPGEVIWVSEHGARHLLEANVAQYVDEPRDGDAPAAPEVGASGLPFPLRRPDGWPLDRFAVVGRSWEGATVALIGGGPSLTLQQVELVRAARLPCITMNNSYLIAPFADIHYFADYHWWTWHRDREEFKNFGGQKCTIEGTGMLVSDASVFMLHNYGREQLSDTPNGLHTGLNSGFQTLNIAYLAGAKRVLLLGYDMKFQGKKTHWHEGHPQKTPENNYSMYARRFNSAVPQLKRAGVEVINCSPDSALSAFPRGNLESVLSDPRAALV